MNRRRSLSVSYNGSKSKNLDKMRESIFQLKENLNYIKYEWPQCLPEDANPIEMAIQLLDDTSVGLSHKLPDFNEIGETTSESLRRVVNEHYETFNNSIGSYHLLLSSFQQSQNDTDDIKEMLESTSKDIHDKSDILNDLNQTSSRYSEMVDILDAIDELNSTPDKVDQLVIDKKLHQVYDVIANSYAIAEKYKLWNLGAMASIKNYLEIQSNNLFDMIVDELQNEIYLKNMLSGLSGLSWESFTNSRNPKFSSLKTLIIRLNNLEQYIYNAANLDIHEIADSLGEPVHEFLDQQLPKLMKNSVESKDTDYSVLIDSSSKSTNSYHYIYQLLNTASKLNRLDQCLDILSTSDQQEIHGLIFRTIEETKLKDLSETHKLKKLIDYEDMDLDHLGGNTLSDHSVRILRDLFSLVFIKCLIVLQKQKVVRGIIDKIEQASNMKLNNDFFDFQSNWNVMKTELQDLIISYIVKDKNIIKSGNNLASNQGLAQSLKSKQLFKFDNVSHDNKNESLENLFPDLLNINSKDNLTTENNSPYIKGESLQSNLEILVPVNIFNMRIILEFFLIFISGSNNLFNDFKSSKSPMNKSSITFFQQFMKLSFLPKLRDNFDIIFREFVGGSYFNSKVESINNNGNVEPDDMNNGGYSINGFMTDLISLDNLDNSDSKNFSKKKKSFMIYKNAFEFKKLFLILCHTLNTSLTYRNDLSDLVLQFLVKFDQTYQQLYIELLGDNHLQLNQWVKIPALLDLSSVLLSKSPHDPDFKKLVDKELSIMLQNNDIFNINKDDLLEDDVVNHICYLLLTSDWLLNWLPLLRKQSNYNIFEEDISIVDKLKHDWDFLENGKISFNNENNKDLDNNDIYLSLNSEKANEFDNVLFNFDRLKLQSLIVLRYDLRLKAIYYIGKSFSSEEFSLAAEPGDSDQFISKFNKELFSIENKLNNFLHEDDIEKIFLGLTDFLNDLMIKGSFLIRKINNNGIKKILVNIFTLQQMIKILTKNNNLINFLKASVYFELFTKNEIKLVEQINERKLDYLALELKNLIRLIYSEKLADKNGSSFQMSKYNDIINKIDNAY